MSGIFRTFTVLLVCIAVATVQTGCPNDPGTDLDNPAGVALARAATAFVPGGTMTVTVTITAEDGGDISAIGLSEEVPEGWSFVSASGQGTQLPAILPAEGATGTLGFIWIAVPGLPCTFSYTLAVPEDASGPASIRGTVNYYEDAGLLASDESVTHVAAANNPAGVELDRNVGAFTPGGTLEVTVVIRADDSGAISALGLNETVPEGWRYQSRTGESGQSPAVGPAAGDSGTLEFLWITVPEFPCTFTYTLSVPEGATAPATIEGMVNYYEDAGLLTSDATVTTVGGLAI